MNYAARFILCALVLPALQACGDDDAPPADVHGNYTLNVTNGPPGCPIPGWTQGAVTSNVPFRITQNGASVSADVGGAGAIFLQPLLGATHFEGTVTGNTIDLRIQGKTAFNSGSCAYTVDAHAVGTVDGDTLTGSIVYTPNTNSSLDCTAIQSCSSRMNFNGTRPPSAE